jgi:hypothetical protein
MLSRDRAPRAEGERVCAVRRLDAAVVEQTRVRGQHEAAQGTSGELQANASLYAADEQVTARGRRLEWVDEGDY